MAEREDWVTKWPLVDWSGGCRRALHCRLGDGRWRFCAVEYDHRYFGGAVDDPVGYPRYRARGGADIRWMLKGDVIFTNVESAVAEKGETVREGRGFLTPPEALDSLKDVGFNLLACRAIMRSI